MNERYPNLSWALTSNSWLNNKFSDQYKDNPRCLVDLDNLISELMSYNCEGITEKLKDVSSWEKYKSTLSELHIALTVAKNIEIDELKLLPDHYFSGKSPDIWFRSGTFTFYVEVRRINVNKYIADTIYDRLREFLKWYPFCVNVFLSTELSIPKLRGNGRTLQRNLVEESLKIFEERFKEKIANDTLTSSFVIETDDIRFTVTKTNSGKGYPASITSKFIEVPTDNIVYLYKRRII